MTTSTRTQSDIILRWAKAAERQAEYNALKHLNSGSSSGSSSRQDSPEPKKAYVYQSLGFKPKWMSMPGGGDRYLDK